MLSDFGSKVHFLYPEIIFVFYCLLAIYTQDEIGCMSRQVLETQLMKGIYYVLRNSYSC